MSKARNLADLLDANGDVASGALDNVPPSNDASALTTGTLPIARIADGDITAAKLANDAKVVKSATAPSSPSAGDLWQDTSNNVLKYYTGTKWAGLNVNDGGSSVTAAASAADILSVDPSATDGVYWIKGSGAARQVYCDMTNGGYMLVAKINSGDSNWHWNSGYWTSGGTFSESNCQTLTTGQSGKHYLWNEFTATKLKLQMLGTSDAVVVTIPGGARTLYTMFNSGANQSATIDSGSILTGFPTNHSAFQGAADAVNPFVNQVYINKEQNYDFGNCCAAQAAARIGTTQGSVTWGGGGFNTGSKGVGAYWHHRDEHNNTCCGYALSGPHYGSIASGTAGIWVK